MEGAKQFADDVDQILLRGLGQLQETLGEGWEVRPVNRAVPHGERVPAPGPPGEQVIHIQPPADSGGGVAQVLVAARPSLSPLQAHREFRASVSLMHSLVGRSAVLVIAPWLSPRTRDALEELGYNYLDLTGNVSIRLHQPTLIIRTEGDRQNPDRSGRRESQQLRGGIAGRLVRVLADVTPPYRATELAEASGVSLSYVSRLLDALEAEALISREGRIIVDVDWQQIIRARAVQYELLRANPYVEMLAQRGVADVLRRIRDGYDSLRGIGPMAVTGTFAAREAVPAVAVGGQLMIYVPADPPQSGALDRIGNALGLLRADTGADVLLLRAMNNVVFERIRMVNGVPNVALSQLAIDSLGGSGRMPAEGEALLEYMVDHLAEWRVPSLGNLVGRRP